MALALVQHQFASSNANANTVAVTVTSTGAGNLIVVLTSNAGTTTVSGVSDGTNAFTQFPSAYAANGSRSVDGWYLLSSTPGKTTITVTFNATGTFNKTAFVDEVSGFTTPATDGANTATGTAANPTGASVTTTGTTGFLAGVLTTAGGTVTANPTSGNEFTTGGDISATRAACSLISSTAAAHNPAWDAPSGAYATSTVAFKESAGGAFNPYYYRHLAGVA